MKQGIIFEVSTTSFAHAIETLETAFEYKGQDWDKVKASNNMDELINYLDKDGLEYSKFHLKEIN